MNKKAMLAGIVTGISLTACSTSGHKVSQAEVDTIRVGDTKADVQARIGAPDQTSRSLAGGDNWIYAYSRSSPNAKRFIPLLGTFIGGRNVESQTVTVMFDPNGRVSDVTTAYGGTDAQGRPLVTTTDSASSTITTTTKTPTP
jgi:outer membrane protein assembly factor BamE (lipoprotein component of BamABCDE complex)